jgi:hypothetical protein
MRYKAFIEDYFLIDEPKTGKLVPFKFNKVQEMYYGELCELGLEEKGISAPLREFIVKARREGFSSFVLALFAADDILQKNPTESMAVSYKDDATATFRKRYRRYILSYFARKSGLDVSDIQIDSNVLEKYAKQAFVVDATDLVLRHNGAHFYCGTAAARTGGRGGVLQKLLFSEAAHYQDTEKMTAMEIIEGTAQQVDKNSGWIFQESTGNGQGNYFYKTYEAISKGLSRYTLRFYGWRSFYNEEQFMVIASEFTDPDMVKQEYPETVEEAFLASSMLFINSRQIYEMVDCDANKQLYSFLEFDGVNYIDQCETIKDFLVTLEKTNPNRRFYVGIDCARDVDRTVITIIKEKELAAQGGVRGIAIDATGAGDFMPDWFERNSKWFVHRVKFSRSSKNVMYKNLQAVIVGKRTELPLFIVRKQFVSDEWKHFFSQITSLQKEIIGEMLVISHPKGNCTSKSHNYDNCSYHDDYPDSWALAELVFVVVNGVPLGSRPPEENSNFDTAVRRLLNKTNAYVSRGGDEYN